MRIIASYFTIVGLLLFLSTLCTSHYVVFEEVGQVATSVSYLHITLPLNLTSLSTLTKNHLETINNIKNAIKMVTVEDVRSDDPFKQKTYDKYRTVHWHFNYEKFLKQFIPYTKLALDDLHQRGVQLQNQLTALLDIMPITSTASPNQFQYTTDVRFRRSPLAIPLFLAKGVFGTFMGLYNRRQQKQLQKEMQNTLKEQKRLVASLRSYAESFTQHHSQSSGLQALAHDLCPAAQVTLIVKILNLDRLIRDEMDRVTAAIQQAQLRRLSPTLLTSAQIKTLMDVVRQRTASLDAELLLENPTDLFQIETSYIFDGSDVTLILHIPMSHRGATLRLMRFHPFPLSFSSTHFLLPKPTHTLYGISSTEPRLSLDLTEADLEGCYRLGHIHLCERLGVLKSKTDLSCLGAMYAQKFRQSMELCQMDLVPLSENVLQLADNWFFIYSTATFTAYVNCLNHSSAEHHLAIGVNKIHISPTCSVKLKDHVLFSDTSLRVDSKIKQFAWNLDDVSFSASEVEEADEILEQIASEGANHPTLADVRQHTASGKRHVKWIIFFILVGVVAFIGLCVWIVCFVSTHKWWLIRKTLRVLANRVWPAVEPDLYDTPSTTVQPSQDLPMATVSPPPLPAPALVRPSRRSRSQPADLPTVFARTRHRLFS